MDGGEFLKPEPMYAIMISSFPIWYFLSEWIKVCFAFRLFPKSLQLFFHVFFYPFAFSVMISLFLYFAPKLFCFPHIRLWVCLRIFYPYLLVEFSFAGLECPVLSVLFDPRFLFILPSFASNYWFISSSCIGCSNRVALFFSSQHIFAFYFGFRIFACCRNFLICVFSLISHPGFEFFFVCFRRTPIFFTNYFRFYMN